jgi:hypothetical protein
VRVYRFVEKHIHSRFFGSFSKQNAVQLCTFVCILHTITLDTNKHIPSFILTINNLIANYPYF